MLLFITGYCSVALFAAFISFTVYQFSLLTMIPLLVYSLVPDPSAVYSHVDREPGTRMPFRVRILNSELRTVRRSQWILISA